MVIRYSLSGNNFWWQAALGYLKILCKLFSSIWWEGRRHTPNISMVKLREGGTLDFRVSRQLVIDLSCKRKP